MPDRKDIIIYTDQNQNIKLDVIIKDETLWATQKQMAELFEVKVPAISKHLKNIFESGELDKKATVSKMEIVRHEGNRSVARELEFYNLDAIIAVGYRVNSLKATKFRIRATGVLKEFIIKGFVLDDERLKQSKNALVPTLQRGNAYDYALIVTNHQPSHFEVFECVLVV